MIVVDTSALFAILNAEDDGAAYATVLLDARSAVMSTATLVELGLVCMNRLPDGAERMSSLQAELSIKSVDLGEDQAQLAIEAYHRFGKGRGAKARLNLGDCFSYALAKSLDAPLLYKGDDFAHTDIRSALDA